MLNGRHRAGGRDQEETKAWNAQLGTGPSGQTPIQIVITRWSSIEETQKLVGAEVSIDTDTHKLVIENMSSQPVQIRGLKKQN